MHKKIIYILVLIYFVTSCADSFDSVKRGLTGSKRQSADEFLVKKKDPLILPQDFENLPTPDEKTAAKDLLQKAKIRISSKSKQADVINIDSKANE